MKLFNKEADGRRPDCLKGDRCQTADNAWNFKQRENNKKNKENNKLLF